MEVSCSRGKRTVKVNGESYLMPACLILCTRKGGAAYLGLSIPLLAGSCTVNGKTVSKQLAIKFSNKTYLTKEWLLVLRALRDTVMPRSGPSQSKVHKIHAAYVMQAFDLEHPDSGILDTDIVLVRYQRRAYVMESCFLADDLRQCDRSNEFGLLASALLEDTSVTSGALEPVPEACDAESAAAARDLLHPAVVRTKRARVVSVGPRTVTCDNGFSWIFPLHITCKERKTVRGGYRRRLVMKILMTKGACQVNGRTIDRMIFFEKQSPDSTISKRNILAMRAVRDELFPVHEPARNQVHKTVAAFILHAFDQENPESDVLDETVVNVRLNRHGFVKESSFVAGDLRTENKNAFSILTQRFLNDPAVIGGELEPAPADAPACEGSTPDDSGSDAAQHEQQQAKAETEPEASREHVELSDVAVVDKKHRGSKGEVRRGGDGAKTPALPLSIYADSEGVSGGTTMRLKVKLRAMCVNGEEVVSAKKMKVVGGIPMNAGNIAALSALRDDFALGLGASKNVRKVIAAKAFRLWLRRRRTCDILDGTPVSITDAAAKPTADGLLRSITMTAGRLRGVNVERSSVLRELLTTLGATGVELQGDSQDQPVIVVDDDGPVSSGSGKWSKKETKRSREEDVSHSDAATQPAQKGPVGSDEQPLLDGNSRDSSRGETGGERCSSVKKRAKKRRSSKDQETRTEVQPPAQEGETANGTKKCKSVGKTSRMASSGGDEVGTDVVVVSSAGRPKKKRKIKQHGAASCSGEHTLPSTSNKSDQIKTNGSGDSTASSSARQNRGDNSGGTSPKRASKKRSKATENALLSVQPVQPDGSTEAEKRTKKKRRKKRTSSVEKGSESSLGEHEGSMQESAAGTKDVPVIDLTSGCSAAVKKVKKKKNEKKKRGENLRCSYESDGLTEGGMEKKRRKVAKETHRSKSSSEAHGGSARPERHPANSIPDSKRKGSKKKRRRCKREERQKSSDHQAHSDKADGNGEVAGEGYSSSRSLEDEGSHQYSAVQVDLVSDSSRMQEKSERKKQRQQKKKKKKKKKKDKVSKM